jgi:hypothetical protein
LDFGSDEGRLKITNQGFNFLETVFSDGLLNICQEYLRQLEFVLSVSDSLSISSKK